jgi:hypothetical protein
MIRASLALEVVVAVVRARDVAHPAIRVPRFHVVTSQHLVVVVRVRLSSDLVRCSLNHGI